MSSPTCDPSGLQSPDQIDQILVEGETAAQGLGPAISQLIAQFQVAAQELGAWAEEEMAAPEAAATAPETGAQAGEGQACSLADNWIFGAHKSLQTWQNQMLNRGWTPDQISDAINYGQSYPASNFVNPGNPALRFVNPETGQSVVIDTTSGQVLHIGGQGFGY
jgi:hypothetical protein